MIRTSQFKYAIDRTGNGYILYDMIFDPLEQNNLISEVNAKEIRRELSEQILRFLIQTQRRFDRTGIMVS